MNILKIYIIKKRKFLFKIIYFIHIVLKYTIIMCIKICINYLNIFKDYIHYIYLFK